MLRLNTKNSQIINNITSKWKSLSDCMLNTQRYLFEKEKEQMSREMNSLQLIMEEMKIANLNKKRKEN